MKNQQEFWDFLEKESKEKVINNSYLQQLGFVVRSIKSFPNWYLYKKDDKNPLMYLMENHPRIVERLYKDKNAKLIWHDKTDNGETLLNFFLYSLQRKGMYAISYENYNKYSPDFINKIFALDVALTKPFYDIYVNNNISKANYIENFKNIIDKKGPDFLMGVEKNSSFSNLVNSSDYELSVPGNMIVYGGILKLMNMLNEEQSCLLFKEKTPEINIFLNRLSDEKSWHKNHRASHYLQSELINFSNKFTMFEKNLLTNIISDIKDLDNKKKQRI